MKSLEPVFRVRRGAVGETYTNAVERMIFCAWRRVATRRCFQSAPVYHGGDAWEPVTRPRHAIRARDRDVSAGNRRRLGEPSRGVRAGRATFRPQRHSGSLATQRRLLLWQSSLTAKRPDAHLIGEIGPGCGGRSHAFGRTRGREEKENGSTGRDVAVSGRAGRNSCGELSRVPADTLGAAEH